MLLFGLVIAIVQGGVAAEAATHAKASSTTQQSVESATIRLTPVNATIDPNSSSALSLKLSRGDGFFYLKNFGTTKLNGFAMTQTSPNSTIRYCVGQEFIVGNVTTCVDGTAASVVGKGKSLPAITYFSPLAPGDSRAFSSDGNGSGNNTISVSVSRVNIVARTSVS